MTGAGGGGGAVGGAGGRGGAEGCSPTSMRALALVSSSSFWMMALTRSHLSFRSSSSASSLCLSSSSRIRVRYSCERRSAEPLSIFPRPEVPAAFPSSSPSPPSSSSPSPPPPPAPPAPLELASRCGLGGGTHANRWRRLGSSCRNQLSSSYKRGVGPPPCSLLSPTSCSARLATTRVSSSCVRGSSCAQRTAMSGGARG